MDCMTRSLSSGWPTRNPNTQILMETRHCRQKQEPGTYVAIPKINLTNETLIAPCGINCRLCRAYARDKKTCPGCRGDDTFKLKSCVTCRIKNCEKLVEGEIVYCFDCNEFPCARLTHLDKRYRTNYGTSVIDNLRSIEKFGIINFVKKENNKWTCPECGEMVCMHKPQCLSCGYVWRK
jgi:hypothetical protein